MASTRKASRYQKVRAIVLIREFEPGILTSETQWAGFRQQLEQRRQTQVSGMLHVAGVGGSLTQPYLVVMGTTGLSLRNASAAADLPSLPQLLTQLQPVAEALDELHRLGYVHGDVRPETLFFDARGNLALNEIASHYALCGWDHQTQLMSPQFFGSVFPKTYLAPEVSSGGPLSAATDQYALGLVLLELCSGIPPREASSVADAIAGRGLDSSRQRVLSQLRPVLSRVLSPEPNRRYGNCQALLAHADQLLSRPTARKWVFLGLGTAAACVATSLIFQRMDSSNPSAQKQTARETISQQYKEPIPAIPSFPPRKPTSPTETTAADHLLEETQSKTRD